MTPDKYTISEKMVTVGDGHSLYVHEWGTADATTVFLFLHGGPGSGCNDKHKQFFNPSTNRVIFFDQRGAGLSTPRGSLRNNTTTDQISDINTICTKYSLTNLVIVGGSWGSTLALAYTLDSPKRVRGLVLRGLFTGSKSEIDTVNNGRFKDFFPDVWEKFLNRTPIAHRSDPSRFHISQALGNDKTKALESAFAMSELEASIAKLDDRHSEMNIEDFDPAATQIELSYINKLCYMPDNYILENAHKIQTPTWLIQGRYDAVCPPITAYKLSQRMPNSNLIWTNAGHSGSDRENYNATKAVIASFK